MCARSSHRWAQYQLLGLCLNWALFATVNIQAYRYHESFPSDPLRFKFLVCGVLLHEWIQTGFITANSMEMFVYGYGDPSSLIRFHSGWFSVTIMSGMISVMVQTFFAWRVYKFSMSRLWGGSIVLRCRLCLWGYGEAPGFGSYVSNRRPQQRSTGFAAHIQGKLLTVSAVWLTGSSAVDIIIAISMTTLLRETMVYSTITAAMIRSYAITFLTNLNSRVRFRKRMERDLVVDLFPMSLKFASVSAALSDEPYSEPMQHPDESMALLGGSTPSTIKTGQVIREQPQPKTAQMERTAMEPWPTTVMHDLLVMQGSEIARLRAKLETSELSLNERIYKSDNQRLKEEYFRLQLNGLQEELRDSKSVQNVLKARVKDLEVEKAEREAVNAQKGLITALTDQLGLLNEKHENDRLQEKLYEVEAKLAENDEHKTEQLSRALLKETEYIKRIELLEASCEALRQENEMERSIIRIRTELDELRSHKVGTQGKNVINTESLTRIENLSSDSLQGKGKQTREEEWTGTPSSGFELSEVQLLYRPRLGRIADIFHCDMEAIVRSQGITDVLGSRPYIPDIRTDGKNLAAVSPRSEGSLENLNDLTHSTESKNIRITVESQGNFVWTSCPEAGYFVFAEKYMGSDNDFTPFKHKAIRQNQAAGRVELFFGPNPMHTYYAGSYVIEHSESLDVGAFKMLPEPVKNALTKASACGKQSKLDQAQTMYLSGELKALKYTTRRTGYRAEFDAFLNASQAGPEEKE
ncbi:hypothetical protein IEO21_05793 [Rhodonia placenta]|uniref:Uncharacterized protein n=1 Tax=Rhodonia placenta TaxID=104341 RepID=A0A8H7P1K6_9APHY|nr:hypothetical protein IEO21_05793 [Postia placenta]